MSMRLIEMSQHALIETIPRVIFAVFQCIAGAIAADAWVRHVTHMQSSGCQRVLLLDWHRTLQPRALIL